MFTNKKSLIRTVTLLFLALAVADVWSGPVIQNWQTKYGASVLFVATSDLPMVDRM